MILLFVKNFCISNSVRKKSIEVPNTGPGSYFPRFLVFLEGYIVLS